MHPHLSLTSDDYASVERLGQKDWDECLFTPLSFTLSVPDVDIVPNWALKTRGASTTLCCLFPCFGVWSAQPSHCVWPPIFSQLFFRETVPDSLPRSCCRFLVLEAHPLMKQADIFSHLSLNQHP